MFTETISYFAAFTAGLLSFFSPCVLPLIPAFFTFITGISLEELTNGTNADIRRRVLVSTLAYVLGFSLVFILLGASASFLGGFINTHSTWLRIGGGLLIIILGIHLTGWIRIPGLDFEKRVHLREKPLHFLGAFLVGMAFGAGWSPCIGPLLGSILVIAGSRETVMEGMALLGVYSAGLAIPFIMIAVFINFMLGFLRRATRTLKYINKVAGILLILIGISLIGNPILDLLAR
ncbi:MAG: cytochrome c biogenesis protein CcdA [Deltaproteobacteria bacterium]|nr:MAG: cytochrome c biogenesis protein CcdA [Deltaproteobacteria bacterium]